VTAAEDVGPARPRWAAWHPWPQRTLGDSGAVLLAVAAALGAWASHDLPPLPGVLLVAFALVLRRPWLVIVGVGLLASALGAQARDGARPIAAGRLSAEVTLMTDPVAERGGVRAEIRDPDGQRLELHAGAAEGRTLRPRLAGERIAVEGAVTPRRPDDEWLLRRHVLGSVRARSLRVIDDGALVAQAANAVRRSLERGAASLPADERALYTGFVFGDDRNERPEVIEDFRASGLSHLLAVSGENVAFVLVAARPLLRRLGVRSRLLVAVALLAFFAFATRLEPSVLRATAMAMIAVYATAVGRPISALRTLALAVTVLLLIDPFLVGIVGFQLSVAASTGIILLARPFAARLPGPRAICELLGVTMAAQVGVAPILLGTFGAVPVVSVPANLLAVPAAGPVMVWGLTGGLVAGLTGGPLAAAVHLPTHLLLWWVATVARVAGTLPLGDLGAAPGAVLLLAGLLLVVTHGVDDDRPALRTRARGPARVVAGVALLSVLVAVRPVPRGDEVRLGTGATLHNGAAGESVLVVDGSADVGDVLGGLRTNGVRRLDVLVARSRGRTIDATVATLIERKAPRLVLTSDAPLATRGDVVEIGTLTITVVETAPRLTVGVRHAVPSDEGAAAHGVGSARGPPCHPRHHRWSRDGRISGAFGPAGGGARARSPPVRHHVPGDRHGDPEPHPGLVLRQGQLLGVRRVPGEGRGPRAGGCRLPRCGRGQGRPR
jgi:competence protein ComEC